MTISFNLAHYALATRNTDLVIYLLKVMVDVNIPTFDMHNGLLNIFFSYRFYYSNNY